MVTLLALLLTLGPVHAAEVEFRAEIDREEISQDQSVALKFMIRAPTGEEIAEPVFDAPDFDLLNTYQSHFLESVYENGRFSVKLNRRVTKVLRPRRTGDLSISGLSVRVGASSYSSAPLTVRVTPGGAGTPPPKRYGGNIGLGGTRKRVDARSFFVRAEVDQAAAYKGEQIIVSYYLYRRARVFNIQVTQYPILKGFLREDLDLPVLRGRLEPESVTLDGMPYQRSLLARYAAYPLEAGDLRIDSMTIKANYYDDASGGGTDENDPFFRFFRQMTPRSATIASDPVSIAVRELPQDGKPAAFSGGVGDFSVISAIDRYQVRANEPVTLTVKVEGRGNVAAIDAPAAKWPDSMDLFESKGRTKTGQGGIGEKVFEFLLIPREPGKVVIPGLEFAFFNPDKGGYSVQKTEPVEIQVDAPAPGSSVVRKRKRQEGSLQAEAVPEKPGGEGLMPLRPPSGQILGLGGLPWWRWLYWVAIGAFVFLISWAGYDSVTRRVRASREGERARGLAISKSWGTLASRAESLQRAGGWPEVVESYERLAGAIFDAIDNRYGVGSRALSRAELGRILVEERGLSSSVWEKADTLLEYAETVRFAGKTGIVNDKQARADLRKWVAEGERVARRLNG